jgi:hypothetical protein
LVNFTLRPLYRWGNNPRFKLHKNLGRPQNLSAGNRNQFLGRPACSLVSKPTELSRLKAGVMYCSFKDHLLLSSERSSYFQIHKLSWNEYKFRHQSRRGPKPKQLCWRGPAAIYSNALLPSVFNVQEFRLYLTGNTLRLRYKAQPVNAFWGNSRCLLWESYEIYKYTVWAK